MRIMTFVYVFALVESDSFVHDDFAEFSFISSTRYFSLWQHKLHYITECDRASTRSEVSGGTLSR